MTDFSDRHTYLGASEVAQALGVSQWGSAHELWEQKTQRRGPTAHKDIFDRGHFMEDAMVEIMLMKYGVKVNNRQSAFFDSSRPWLRSHADGTLDSTAPHIGNSEEIVQEGWGIVEMKAPGQGSLSRIRKVGLSMDNLLQIQFNMYNSGAKWGVIVVMDYENWDVEAVYVEYDEELVRGSLVFLEKFWGCVEHDIEPPRVDSQYMPFIPEHSGSPLDIEDPEFVKSLSTLDARLNRTKDSIEARKDSMISLMLKNKRNHLRFIGDGAIVMAKWSKVKGKTTIDGKELASWVEVLRSAVKDGNVSLTKQLVEKYSIDTFTRQGEPHKRFNYKVEEENE